MTRNITSRYFGTLGFVAALFLCTQATAVVLRTISDAELLERATHISLSEVQSVESFRRGGRILSWVELRVIKSFRGASGTVRLLVPGGQIGNLTQIVPGGPTFPRGTQRLYFLEHLPTSDGFRLVGFSQGIVSSEQSARFNRLQALVSASSLPKGVPQLETTQ